MADLTVTHRKVTSGATDDNAEVDLSDWNDTHVVTGMENIPNVDTTLSSNIYYTSTATGAVSRSLDSKLGEFLSVKDFGAIADAVADAYDVWTGTDNTSAFQAAATWANTLGRATIDVPAGNYVIGTPNGSNSTIKAYDNVSWRMDDQAQILSYNGPAGNFSHDTALFVNSNQTVSTSGVTISSITRSGTTATLTTSSAHGLEAGRPLYVTVTGATPSGYNVSGKLAIVTGASTFTYQMAADPGSSASVVGTYSIKNKTANKNISFEGGRYKVAAPAVVRTGSMANGAAVITGLSDTNGIVVGMGVCSVAAGFPYTAGFPNVYPRVVSKTSTTVTISSLATGAISSVQFTFGYSGGPFHSMLGVDGYTERNVVRLDVESDHNLNSANWWGVRSLFAVRNATFINPHSGYEQKTSTSGADYSGEDFLHFLGWTKNVTIVSPTGVSGDDFLAFNLETFQQFGGSDSDISDVEVVGLKGESKWAQLIRVYAQGGAVQAGENVSPASGTIKRVRIFGQGAANTAGVNTGSVGLFCGDDAARTAIDDIKVNVNFDCSSVALYGAWIYYASNVDLSGSTIKGANRNSILATNAPRLKYIGGSITDQRTNTYSAIFLSTAATNATICGIDIPNGLQKHGIEVAATGAEIIGNRILAAANNGINTISTHGRFIGNHVTGASSSAFAESFSGGANFNVFVGNDGQGNGGGNFDLSSVGPNSRYNDNVGITPYTAVADANYTVTLADRIIAVTSLTATRTITLPAASLFDIFPLKIIDRSGSASGSVKITIARAGSDTIDGATSLDIVVPYGGVELLSNGSNAWQYNVFGITQGGTGATTAAAARTNLGVTATGADTTYAFRSNNLSDLANAGTARSNLGLATVASSGSASDLSTGTLPSGRLSGDYSALVERQFMGGGSGGTGVAAGATIYLGPGYQQFAFAAIAGIVMPFSGTAKNLYVISNAAPVGAETYTFTLNKNGSDQAVTCQMTGAAVTAHDTTHSFTFAAGDYICLKAVTSASAAAGSVFMFGFEADNP